ncbi:MAG: BrnT family toxin [Treponema sp.]|nr:BrnT family toxin [Treponema sp.]
MNFEWDPKKDRINKKIHGISFSTAKFVFNDTERWERYDSSHSEEEDRWQTIGLVDKVLFVVYTEQGDNIRIISARMADEKELRVYDGKRNIAGWTKAN